jgi:hypothetical protein
MTDNLDQTIDTITQGLKNLVVNNDSGEHLSNAPYIIFQDDPNNVSNKGIVWRGKGWGKQLVYNKITDKIFCSESIELGVDKNFLINGVSVLSNVELGNTVVKSSLTELGILKGLVVEGSVIVDQHLHYSAASNRLGLGIQEPNAAFSVFENGVEVILGTQNNTKGVIGTYSGNDLDIVTGNVSRITLEAGGDIRLGSKGTGPVKVTINGKLSVGVTSHDDRASLHVAGAIRFNDKLHRYASGVPQNGQYDQGDIIWNALPRPGSSVGWICVIAGNPGLWSPFGDIKSPVT